MEAEIRQQLFLVLCQPSLSLKTSGGSISTAAKGLWGFHFKGWLINIAPFPQRAADFSGIFGGESWTNNKR